MPTGTKIMLSAQELSLVKNSEWILTKQAIIQKVYDILASHSEAMNKCINHQIVFPVEVRLSVPKIYKGENYRQLPYVLLDYPRYFDKEEMFVVRTMFWWANFFSITLLLSGEYKSRCDITAISKESNIPLYICVSKDPWQHHFENDNYKPVKELSEEAIQQLVEEKNFIKLAVKYDLDPWNDMNEQLKEGYKRLTDLLINYPTGETTLSPGIPTTDSDL